MSYIGENELFSFRDGYCESKPGAVVTSNSITDLGRILAGRFGRFSAACDSFSHVHLLYALCCGLSECGRDVYVSENTDLSSFRFSFPILSSDCGIYISGSGSTVKISFYTSDRFPFTDELLAGILEGAPAPIAEKSGKMTSAASFRDIYKNNVSDSSEMERFPVFAGISCGNRSVRSLWLEFFTGEDEKLVFQISDDGQRVNAYSVEAGFISYEKLLLAFAVKSSENGEVIYLPESFHYAADLIDNAKKLKIKRFAAFGDIPDSSPMKRAFCDPLYMTVILAEDKQSFIELIKGLPHLAAAKRDVTVSDVENIPLNRSISDCGGRVVITRSGRNRISLLAQSYSSETAAELCSSWTDKLRKMGNHDII